MAHDGANNGIFEEIWDLAPLAWLVNSEWARSALVSSPILSESFTWSRDPRRHFIREVLSLQRDAIFGDLFEKLAVRCAYEAGN